MRALARLRREWTSRGTALVAGLAAVAALAAVMRPSAAPAPPPSRRTPPDRVLFQHMRRLAAEYDAVRAGAALVGPNPRGLGAPGARPA